MPASPKEMTFRVRSLISSKSRVDLEVLLADLIDAFGGTQALALEMRRLYKDSKSDLVKQKLLMMIQQLVHATTIHGLAKGFDPRSFSDQDLEDLMANYCERIENGKLIPGTAGTSAAAVIAAAGTAAEQSPDEPGLSGGGEECPPEEDQP